MVYTNLTDEGVKIDNTKDSIVIVDNLQSIRGGRSLDVTGFAPDVIQAGHLIIKNDAGDHKPMPVNAGATAYEALPANHTYAGILIASIRKVRPFAGILVRGTVNPNAAPYDFATIATAVKTALPLIDFRAD